MLNHYCYNDFSVQNETEELFRSGIVKGVSLVYAYHLLVLALSFT